MFFNDDVVDNFISFLTEKSPWYAKVPGGFLNNYPKRLVNAYGTGAAIDNKGNLKSDGLKNTAWTAKISQSDVSLHT